MNQHEEKQAVSPAEAAELIRHKLALLPDKPGCYLMKNHEGTIIYVGKAKVLKNRVRSYFTGSHNAKTQRLVSEIRDFEYIITSSNMEALILECNLIKQHHPRYNVLLKDDKTFPYIKITHEEQPRLKSRGGCSRIRANTSALIRMPCSPADEEAAGPAVSAAQMQDDAR